MLSSAQLAYSEVTRDALMQGFRASHPSQGFLEFPMIVLWFSYDFTMILLGN